MLLHAGACLLACCLLAGCAPTITGTVTGRNSTSSATSTPHTDSDPGDRKLNLLATDPALVNLPAGLVRTSVQRTPAHYETRGFGSGGSFGAGVTVTFTSTASPADVYKAIAENAACNGWVAKGSNSAGLTNRWLKTYPDGTLATLFLGSEDPNAVSPTHTYSLNGGI
ncbi:hypothetical protein [Arthrobacter sp. SAFR-044]|uniref:hypothetical protein n=1 Tax=Arthrobacter sp. SAFR-044 TaxID=3387278 RepID=UPI003F7C150B